MCMTETLPRCCGRPMTSIAVEHAASALSLHSCPSCGRHRWLSDGAEVDQPTVLAALRVDRKPSAAKRRPAPAAPARLDEVGRRAELQRMLGGFTVHGTTS